MKKLLFVLFLVPVLCFSAFSQIATINEAELLAERIFHEKYISIHGQNQSEYKIESAYSNDRNNQANYYVFNFSPKGFVIVAAEKKVEPLMAFSINSICPEDNLSPQFTWWMEGKVDQIKNVQERDVDAKVHPSWARLLADDYSIPAIKKSGGKQPLLVTTWNQSPYFNNDCPADASGPGGYCLSGCVATTLGQLMAYFRHPEQGVGSYSYVDENYGEQHVNFAEQTYNWDEMPSYLDRENDAIAALLYHIGVSVDMEYGPNGSGMTNHKGAYTLETYFDYTDSTQYLFRDSIEIDWPGMLISSLDQDIPLYYAGWTDTNYVMGHAFVCDGYNDSSYFHFNWGWGGSYDGYFNIDNLKPGSNDLTLLHEAIINATPKSNYPHYFTGLKTLTTLDGLIGDGSGPLHDYQANNNCQWLIQPKDSTGSIRLSFKKMDILATDYLYVYDGENVDAELLGTYSGSVLPEDLKGSTNSMYLVFAANSEDAAGGFLVGYSVDPVEYCESNIILNDLIGTISDGSNSFQYNNNMNCTWSIMPEESTLIGLKFNYLDTEPENDFVRIYDADNKVIIGEYSGNTLPEYVEVLSSNILVKFFTNSKVRGDGFSLDYELFFAGVKNTAYNQVRIYPNPVNEKLTVVQNDGKGCTIKMMDLSAKVLFQQSFQGTQVEMPVDRFENGIYILQVENSSGTVSQKICIQR